MTDYKWEMKQRKEQKRTFLAYRNINNDGNSTQIDSIRALQKLGNEVSSRYFKAQQETIHNYN